MEALKLDVTGACYTVYPDCPIFDFRNANFGLIFALIAFNTYVCRPLGLNGVGHKTLAGIILSTFCFFLLMFVLFH